MFSLVSRSFMQLCTHDYFAAPPASLPDELLERTVDAELVFVQAGVREEDARRIDTEGPATKLVRNFVGTVEFKAVVYSFPIGNVCFGMVSLGGESGGAGEIHGPAYPLCIKKGRKKTSFTIERERD